MLLEAAVFNAVIYAREHARRVGDALFFAYLRAGGVEISRTHAEVARRDFEAAPCPRARLFEYQRNILAVAYFVRYARLLLRLERGGEVDKIFNLFGSEIQKF